MKNQFFNLDRFSRYVKYFCTIQKRDLLLQYGSVFAACVIVMIVLPLIENRQFSASFHEYPYFVNHVCFWLLNWISILFAGAYTFKLYADKNRRYSELTVPASNFEKFTTYVLTANWGIYLCFLASFWVVDHISVNLFNHLYHMHIYAPVRFSSYWRVGPTIGICFAVSGFFTLGSAIWPKKPLVKAFTAAAIIFICIFISITYGLEFTDIHHNHKHITEEQARVLLTVIPGLFGLGEYALAYLRFKELETINRW